MSTNVNPQGEIVRPAASPTPGPTPPGTPDEVRVISHSNIYYWWPVWAVGFIMFLWTWFVDGHRMVTVPAKKTEAVHAKDVRYTDAGKTITLESADIIVVEGKGLPRKLKDQEQPDPVSEWRHMAANKTLGVIFCTTLLLVIVITNVPLRGMWSVVVIITIVLLTVILALAGVWEWIVTTLSLLDIRINAGGYLFISLALFTIWLVALVAFDRQRYIIFTPGRFIVRESIGDSEKAYDTIGMTLEKQKGDVFRHYILGLGSGDLVVRTTGAQAHHFDLPNVLFIGRKVQQIEEMLRTRGVKTS
jgi:hypothetical protein